MTTMKKTYEKPSMQVFDLKQQPQLLQASAGRSPYGAPIPGDWG